MPKSSLVTMIEGISESFNLMQEMLEGECVTRVVTDIMGR